MKAEYICADQPVTLISRLRQSGGPYIPVCLSLGRRSNATVSGNSSGSAQPTSLQAAFIQSDIIVPH
jgi:hypothetical protein